MANDIDMHELATRSPVSVLRLIGLRPRGEYRVASLPVKATSRTVDLLFSPLDRRDPRVYLEWQAKGDPTVEWRLLEEVVVDCSQRKSFSNVVAVVVYTKRAILKAARSADIVHRGRDVLRFTPIRVVLSELDPAVLMADRNLRVALPLVGPVKQVKAEAPTWLMAVRRAARSEVKRSRDTDLFVRFLSTRLDKMDMLKFLKGAEDLVKDTATGRALLKEGRAVGFRRSIELVLTTRLGALPAKVRTRLEREDDLDRLEAILAKAACVETKADLAELFAT